MRKFIPILYSTPMVQAIDYDSKIMTRRTKGLDSINESPNDWILDGVQIMGQYIFHNKKTHEEFWIKSPYGDPGDVLWVRETYCGGVDGVYFYKAVQYSSDTPIKFRWIGSIHMPKSACRLFTEVVSIRLERLQNISEADAIAEGIKKTWISDDPNQCMYKNYIQDGRGSLSAVNSFHSLWQSINGPSSWIKNPWVWVIEFEKIDKPQDFI